MFPDDRANDFDKDEKAGFTREWDSGRLIEVES